MGRVWSVDAVAKNDSTSFYGTIVALAESPLVEGLIYAGTDDGLIQVTEDGGQHWRKVENFPFTNKPADVYVSDIETSQHDPNTVYACFDNHKSGDFKPYVLKSTDRGKSWTNIGGDLPERGSAYTIAVDHGHPTCCSSAPSSACSPRATAASTGRRSRAGCRPSPSATWRFSAGRTTWSWGRSAGASTSSTTTARSAPCPRRRWTRRPPSCRSRRHSSTSPPLPLAGGEKAYQGASFYTAPNPPFGATFTYYLKDSLKTKKAARQEQEGKLEREGKDVNYPAWDDLKAEDREEPPVVILTIKNAEGQVVRRLSGPGGSGLHRVTWDLRWPGYRPVTGGEVRRRGRRR